MNWPRRRIALLAASLLLVACADRDDGQPGAVTADQAHQLNDAAVMLDANSVDANMLVNDQDPS